MIDNNIKISMTSTPCPCKGCLKHTSTCHSNCTNFREWDTIHRKEREEVSKKRNEYSRYCGYVKEICYKNEKRIKK
jgi:hypothetical protein